MRDPHVELMVEHVEALYVHDERSRITAINQWEGGVAPRFYLGRTPTGHLSRIRDDIPDDLAEALRRYVVEEPVGVDLKTEPRYHDSYMTLLAAHSPIQSTYAGPVFRFPRSLSMAHELTVAIDETNADLLQGGMEEWLLDVPHQPPFLAVVEDGRAVSVCISVRIIPVAHEAGVETLPAYRQRGYAVRVVAAWASAVRSLRASPFYSTSWDNIASQNVARSLGLQAIGADFHVI